MSSPSRGWVVAVGGNAGNLGMSLDHRRRQNKVKTLIMSFVTSAAFPVYNYGEIRQEMEIISLGK